LNAAVFCLSVVELIAMCAMAFEVARIVITHILVDLGRNSKLKKCCCGDLNMDNYTLWYRFFHALCHTLRVMSNFSAMKTLAHLNPQVLWDDLQLKIVTSGNACQGILIFLVSRVALGGVGFLAFAIKFAQVVDALHAEKKKGTVGWRPYEMEQILILAGFCNQMFGITQLWRIQETRLMLFLFGGQNAQMDAEEIGRQNAFLADITQTVCTEMYKTNTHNDLYLNFKRFITILSLTHYDMQAFVLEDEEKQPTTRGVSGSRGVSGLVEGSFRKSEARDSNARRSNASVRASFVLELREGLAAVV